MRPPSVLNLRCLLCLTLVLTWQQGETHKHKLQSGGYQRKGVGVVKDKGDQIDGAGDDMTGW